MIGTLVGVLALVLGFSLYDFISSRSWLMVTAEDRNDSVFEHRNQRYGAYKIRRDYNMLVIIILLSVSGAVAASYGVSVMFRPAKVKKDSKREVEYNKDLFAEDQKKDDKIIEPLDKPVPEEQKTLAFVPPVIVNKPTDDELTTQEELTDVDAGSETNDGSDFGGTPVDEVKVVEEVKPVEPEIFDVVEEDAEFPGGQAAMADFLRKNMKYPEMALDAGIGGKVYLRFAVSAQGNISNVRVTRGIPDCPECDKEAKRVVESMPAWKPGKNNGKAVNCWFNLPVRFNPG